LAGILYNTLNVSLRLKGGALAERRIFKSRWGKQPKKATISGKEVKVGGAAAPGAANGGAVGRESPSRPYK